MEDNNETIRLQLEMIRNQEGDSFQVEESEILQKHANKHKTQSPISVKILSVFGGIGASFVLLAFTTFIFFSSSLGLESALFLGLFSLVGSWFLDKRGHSITHDTLMVTTQLIGMTMVGVYIGISLENTTIMLQVGMITSLASLFLFQNRMSNFISVIITGGCLSFLVLLRIWDGDIPTARILTPLEIITATIGLLLTFWILNESKIITFDKRLMGRYDPIRFGLIVLFVANFTFLESLYWDSHLYSHLPLIVSIPMVIGLLWTIHHIIQKLKITDGRQQVIIFGISTLIFVSSIFFPSILGSMLLILLSYLVNMKSGLVVGILSLIIFSSFHYYTMQFTLWTKSIFLMSAGVLLLALYFFTKNTLLTDEKA